jgi:hypothetical protein
VIPWATPNTYYETQAHPPKDLRLGPAFDQMIRNVRAKARGMHRDLFLFHRKPFPTADTYPRTRHSRCWVSKVKLYETPLHD